MCVCVGGGGLSERGSDIMESDCCANRGYSPQEGCMIKRLQRK